MCVCVCACVCVCVCAGASDAILGPMSGLSTLEASLPRKLFASSTLRPEPLGLKSSLGPQAAKGMTGRVAREIAADVARVENMLHTAKLGGTGMSCAALLCISPLA